VIQGGSPCDALSACFTATPLNALGYLFQNCTTPANASGQYVWSFGDGAMGSGFNADHAYQEPGSYTVCLTVYWENCVDSTCTTITVGQGGPCNPGFNTGFGWTAQGNAVVFQAESNVPVNGYIWSFGDGTEGYGEVVTHLFEPPGPFTVCLSAWYWNVASNDTCWTDHCQVVEPFVQPTGIASSDLPALRFWPVPAHDVLTIDGLSGPALLALYAMDGRLLLSRRSSATTYQLHLDHPAPGTYLLRVELDAGTIFQRVVEE
jgi:hypothetical protein